MSCHVKFLNHSCLILSSPTTKILCDPWFKGTAFGNGWSLLFDNSHDINSLDFDYIWISHEHPDHFSIPTLLDLNRSCTFLFQETKDKKVKTFLEGKGHSVIELKHQEATKIGDLELTCIVCDGYDSSLLVQYPDRKLLLNINDARIELNDHLCTEILPLLENRTIDMLVFQFSYANWAGNPGDNQIPRYLQNEADCRADYAISRIKPKLIMPFASFIYFSHEENYHWNDNNWLHHVFQRYTSSDSILIFPKPDQEISLSEIDRTKHIGSNRKSLDFWLEKHQNLSVKDCIKPASLNEIEACYLKFNARLNKENPLLSLVENSQNFFLTLKIHDLKTTIRVGLFKSSFEVVKDVEAASVSSETANFLFNHLFARGTVSINGRVSFNYEKAHLFFLFFFVPYANNIGIYFNQIQKLQKEMLWSVMRTAVMMAISHVCKEVCENSERDVNLLFDILRNAEKSVKSYDIFNNEPQNEMLN